MGNLMKKAGFALASFGLATAALGGSYTEGCDCEITIPKYAGGIRVGVEALYFGVDIKDTEYAFTFQQTLTDYVFRSHNVDTDKDWGYALELAYVAAGTGNDFVVNWTDQEFNASDTIALAGTNSDNSEIHTLLHQFFFDSGGDGVYDYVEPGTPDPNFNSDEELASAKGSFSVDYTKIDLEAGQAIQIGHDSVTLRFHAGLRYADIDTKFQGHFESNESGHSGYSANYKAESDWDGLGPRMGVDGNWHVGNGFTIVAEISAAVLVGDANSTQKWEDSDGETSANDFHIAHRVSYDHVVVPMIETRLGVNYAYHFSNSSELNLEVGYQVTNYFDVDYKVDNSGTDVGFYGLYLKADYTI